MSPTPILVSDLKGSSSLTFAALGLVVWLFWTIMRILQGKSEVLVKCRSNFFTEWLCGLHYLTSAPQILDKHYVASKAGNVSFTLPSRENYFVHVTSEKHIKELSEAPEDRLSLHALAKDMMQFKYTMGGLIVHDVRNANGNIHFRVVGSLLRSNLRILHPGIHKTVVETFAAEIMSDGKAADGWTSIRTFPMVKNLIRTTNSLVFFGSDLTHDTEYLEALLAYPEDVVATSEVLRFTPTFLAPTVASLMMRRGRAVKHLIKRLLPVVERRMQNKNIQGSKPTDILQWMIDSSPRSDPWSATKIVQVTLGLWFGSIHQPAMAIVYALYDLCRHPEYMEALREEITQHSKANAAGDYYEHMPLLDSFLKESARFSPSDSISLRRKAIAPYTFSDGVRVNPGDVACIPMRAIMADEDHYPAAATFNGYRFVNDTNTGSIAKLTDVETKFPIWGFGRRACPGRFYAAHAEKTIISHLLLNYEFKFAQPAEKARSFSWRSAVIPFVSTKLLFRERKVQEPVNARGMTSA